MTHFQTLVSAEADVIAHRLVGAWDLDEWSEIHSDGTKAYPLGEDALGQLLYSEDGHVAAQLVRAPRTKFEAEDWRAASHNEAARAFKEYFGYFGTYSNDLGRKAVIHHVRGAWFPNVEGSDQARTFKFGQGRLVLDADTDWGRVRIVWRRAATWDATNS
jgi:hypothetical protein